MSRLLPLLLVAAVAAAQAAPLTREASDGALTHTLTLSQDACDLTQELELRETLVVPPGHAAALPPLEPADLDGLGVLELDPVHARTDAAGRQVLERRARLEPLRPGAVALRTRWLLHGPEAAPESEVLVLPPLEVQVAPAPADAPRELSAAPGLLGGPAPRWPWALAALGALALVGGALLLWRRRRAPRAPHELAFDALARLDAAGHLPRGEVEAYLTRLVAILRDYLGARFAWPCDAQTSAELLDRIARSPRLRHLEPDLTALTALGDAVKFAGARAPASVALEARDAVERAVEATRPAPEPAEDPSPAPVAVAMPHAFAETPRRTS
ncbi:MAG: hypothetical protein R3F62_24745 [Planctomycetota bacterium]